MAVFAVVYATGVHAQNDPVIRTGGGHGSVPVTSLIFSVASPSGNSPALTTVPNSTDCVLTQKGVASSVPQCFFQNKITLPKGKGVTISRLVFIVDSAEYTGPLTCGTDTTLGGTGPFATCTVQPTGDGSFSVITFSNGSIPPGGDFSMGMRGFNSEASFPAIALPSPDWAGIYQFPDPSSASSDPLVAVNDAPRFIGCQSLQIRALCAFRRDRSGSSFIAAWISSNGPISGGMPGPSRITFEAFPSSNWRIT